MEAVAGRRGLILVLALALVARLAAVWLLGAGLARDPDGYWALAASLARHGVFGYTEAESAALDKFPLTAAESRPAPDATNGGRILPTAFRPPLYPLALAALTGGERVVWRVAAFQVTIGVLTVCLTWRLAGAYQLSTASRLMATTIVAIDPILLAQTAQTMTECFATFLAAAALLALAWALPCVPLAVPVSDNVAELGKGTGTGGTSDIQGQPLRMAIAGAAGAVAALCRPTFLLWMLLVGALLAWRALTANATTRRESIQRFFAYAVAALLVLSPWAARNALVFGRPIVTTTHGGYTLLLGNNHFYYDFLRENFWSGVWPADALQQELEQAEAAAGAHDELARDRVAFQMGSSAIAAQPAMFAVASVKRLSRLWGCLPEQLSAEESTARRAARYGAAAVLAMELLLAALGAWLLGRRLMTSPWIGSVLLALAFTTTHAVFWADLRMRAPLAPVIALLAAAAIPRGYGKRRPQVVIE